MRNFLSLLAFCLGLVTLSQAQTGLRIGIQGGGYVTGVVNNPSSNYQGDYSIDVANPYTKFKEKYGYSIGGVLGFGISRSFGFQAEFNYAGIGQKAKNGDGTLVRDITLNYFQIPLLIKVATPEGAVRFYALLGPQAQFFISESHTYTASDNNASTIFKVGTVSTNSNRYSNFDIGAALGLGVDIYPTDQLYINAGLRFYYGFLDINATGFRNQGNAMISSSYSASNNVYGGLNLGIHYLLADQHK